MRGKGETEVSDVKVSRLENDIANLDLTINTYLKKIEGVKKVKKNQDKTIEKDINDDLIGSVDSIKK